MSETLSVILQASERERSALLNEIEELDAPRLTAKPSPNAWSIAEIVEHMVVSERGILQNLPDTAQLVPQKVSAVNRFTLPVVMGILRWRIPVHVPDAKMLPQGQTPFDELRREWDENQQWLRNYVAEVERSGKDEAVFAHIIAGPLTAAQAIRMGRLHIAYHARQIREIIAQTGGGTSKSQDGANHAASGEISA